MVKSTNTSLSSFSTSEFCLSISLTVSKPLSRSSFCLQLREERYEELSISYRKGKGFTSKETRVQSSSSHSICARNIVRMATAEGKKMDSVTDPLGEPETLKTEDVGLEVVSENLHEEESTGKRSSKTADHIFDKIFHSPPSAYFALKLYGKIIPGNPHKQKLQPGDSKWMIHPYSRFK